MKILDCGLTLELQKIYIQRLKVMLNTYDLNELHSHCPISIKFDKTNQYEIFTSPNRICKFCRINVNHVKYCPCLYLGPKEAVKRGRDFIARFESQHEN